MKQFLRYILLFYHIMALAAKKTIARLCILAKKKNPKMYNNITSLYIIITIIVWNL